MPFRSKKMEKWMWANKPELARKWTNKYGSYKQYQHKKYKKEK